MIIFSFSKKDYCKLYNTTEKSVYWWYDKQWARGALLSLLNSAKEKDGVYIAQISESEYLKLIDKIHRNVFDMVDVDRLHKTYFEETYDELINHASSDIKFIPEQVAAFTKTRAYKEYKNSNGYLL